MVVKGGIQGQPGNPRDPTDEGVFISKINEGGCASANTELCVGQRIIEVNGQSLLGATHAEAVGALRNAGNSIQVSTTCNDGGLHSTEVAYLLLTQQPRVRS